MTDFANAVVNQTTLTENGMTAYVQTGDACLDLFYKIGASRNKDITPAFVAAYAENRELALRIALWARDVREGAGERKTFRTILNYLGKFAPEDANLLLNRVPDLGRWDDVFSVFDTESENHALKMLEQALKTKDGLAAKWVPREKQNKVLAKKIRDYLGLSPKMYRKLLVSMTNVVEQKMCSKNWDKINYSHVPSVASARYRKAFLKNDKERYGAYVEELSKPVEQRDPNVKINAGAIFPHDIIRSIRTSNNPTEASSIVAQWDALPNYVGDNYVLPMIDVSGSMQAPVSGSIMAIDVAQALGLYFADKNTGPFKDVFLTFSKTPKLQKVSGNIVQKYQQCSNHFVENTNIEKAFEEILRVAKDGKVSKEDMPKYLLILSDMQFDQSVANSNPTAFNMAKAMFKSAGYDLPNVIFWNINSRNGVPVQKHETGTALVSGFSPAIAKSLLENIGDFTPHGIMMNTVLKDRYDF